MRYASPLRYPGGKACLSQFLEDTIDINDLRGCSYFEPYAGGAGAALKLLYDGVVTQLFLNDLDYRVYAFWKSALERTDEFISLIGNTKLDIEEWRRQNEICQKPGNHKLIQIGFAAFYMNRCNRSGIITGAGPIGGYEQQGTWRMDVRYNREALSERIWVLGRHRRQIHISRADAIAFLRTRLPRGRRRREVFVYIDPPYVGNGQRLYLNAYVDRDHRALSKYLNAQSALSWLVSYDDAQLVRECYGDQRIRKVEIQYALQTKRAAQELLIVPNHLALPGYCRKPTNSRELVKVT